MSRSDDLIAQAERQVGRTKAEQAVPGPFSGRAPIPAGVAIEDTETIPEPEDVEHYVAFYATTKRRAPQNLRVCTAQGRHCVIPWHQILGARFDPAIGLLLQCVDYQLLIRGRNLYPLLRDLGDNLIHWLQELDAKAHLEPSDPDATVITGIYYRDGRDHLTLTTLDHALAHELGADLETMLRMEEARAGE